MSHRSMLPPLRGGSAYDVADGEMSVEERAHQEL